MPLNFEFLLKNDILLSKMAKRLKFILGNCKPIPDYLTKLDLYLGSNQLIAYGVIGETAVLHAEQEHKPEP